ncbi:uncharacterized protein LOC119668699 [Teleopsis dalmanni]|uniref:uncharacterized protein LOC119668699 n=1 Tax=Teleopsis dalmanni TaxID=139649 RepID=UPI0018CE7CF8|nr:uncharacterized protein LOC119668699 [Teleopsis dalmanni]
MYYIKLLMLYMQDDQRTSSNVNLIEVQHVGVTARLKSPIKNLLQNSTSSIESEHGHRQVLFNNNEKRRYDNLVPDSTVDTGETTEASKVLYEMHAVPNIHPKYTNKGTPSKIEFQLYNKNRASRSHRHRKRSRRTSLLGRSRIHKRTRNVVQTSICSRLRQSFENLCKLRTEEKHVSIIDDLPEPTTRSNAEVHIGIYPFEHGSADYLRTNDAYPLLVSYNIAERATDCATRFWAEFFGSLYIGVAFIVTFILQTYRFLLYSFVNTLLVGLLHMTADYFLKPLLTVCFNGFIQPLLTLLQNIFTSIRNALEPISDTFNNCMKPVATVFSSFRIVEINHRERQFEKEV